MKKVNVFVGIAVLAMMTGALLTVPAATAADNGATANVRDANGNLLGKIRFNATDDGKVLVKVSVAGLAPGFHGFHVHGTGVCNASAVDGSNAPSPFFTSGGHHNPGAAPSHGAHAGDMPPLLVNSDGTAETRFEIDRFTVASLLTGDGSAVIVHAAPDNLANIPAATAGGAPRYHSHSETSQTYTFGPDTATKATGDSGARFGCGILTSS
jgi:Cu-Zn family superoxide dismutase